MEECLIFCGILLKILTTLTICGGRYLSQTAPLRKLSPGNDSHYGLSVSWYDGKWLPTNHMYIAVGNPLGGDRKSLNWTVDMKMKLSGRQGDTF